MLNVFLTNLGEYNAGNLVGEWVELPISDDDLGKVFDRIRVCHGNVKYYDNCGNPYEEYFISDYETDLGIEVVEYSLIWELNKKAKAISDLSDYEVKAFRAMMSAGYFFDEAMEKIADGEYSIYFDCHDMTDVAYGVVEECGYLRGVPETVSLYFDYEAFGRDLDIEGKFYAIGNDMVEIL